MSSSPHLDSAFRPARGDGPLAVLLALLWVAPVGVLVAGGGGLPTPGSFNDPVRALTAIGASPLLTIVSATIFATGVVQAFVVIALDDRLVGHAPRGQRIGLVFGVISASFLMLDGALGVTALSQIAHLDARQASVAAAYLTTLGVRNAIDRVIPLTLGLWALAVHWPAWRRRELPRHVVILGVLLGTTGVAGAALPAAGTASVPLAALWAGAFAVFALRGSRQKG
jgi:hypothetical protein